jgi:hypothetical protein
MKHLHLVSRTPSRAQDATLGQILAVVAGILQVVASTLTGKEPDKTAA